MNTTPPLSRFMRYGEAGKECPAILDQAGQIRSLKGVIKDLDHTVLGQLDALLEQVDIDALPVVSTETKTEVHIAAPLADPQHIIAVGLNYADHIQETASTTPDEPLLFTKSPHAVCGCHDDIVIPRGAQCVDWEVELVVVIGQEALYLGREEALSVIAGYCVGIDVSERDFQKNRSGQWVKGKSADTFAPLGPYLIPASQVDLKQGLSLWLDVNGQRKQTGNTLQMIHDVPALISYISQFMSLHPGDLIFTGTPDGVGMARQPPEYLQPGDKVRCGIEGLGEQEHLVRKYAL